MASLCLALPLAPTAAADEVRRDDINLAAGTYFREDIVWPADGGVWQATVIVLDGGPPVDVYVLATTDLVLGYPGAAFAPIEARQNVTYANLLWRPADHRVAYSLVVDNLDNSHPDDALPAGAVLVQLVRSPPLRANPDAAAALGAGTTVCASGLALAAVGVAVYLKRRPPTGIDDAASERALRIEVPVEVPQRPRGPFEREAQDAEP